MMLYIGRAPKRLLQEAVPLLAAGTIFLIVVFSCAIILRRLHRITALEALRSGNIGESLKRAPVLHLKKSKVLNVNIFLGIKDVVQRFKSFGLLCFVFFFSVAIILIPIHFLTTIRSPSFITYMGIGQSDMRIDLRQSDNMVERFESMVAYLADDPDVEQFSPLVTSQFTLVQSDGSRETMNIETGDLSLFPLDYVEGVAPQQENEIALSFLNAQDLEKRVGDVMVLLVNGQEQEMVVSGIYQDVTNGGRTAKALLPYNPDSVLWHSVSLNLKSTDRIDDKVHEYSQAFYPARVTDLEGYLSQTMGNTIDQFEKVTIVAIVTSLFVSMLITFLFLSMLITKDAARDRHYAQSGVLLAQYSNPISDQGAAAAEHWTAVGHALLQYARTTPGERTVGFDGRFTDPVCHRSAASVCAFPAAVDADRFRNDAHQHRRHQRDQHLPNDCGVREGKNDCSVGSETAQQELRAGKSKRAPKRASGVAGCEPADRARRIHLGDGPFRIREINIALQHQRDGQDDVRQRRVQRPRAGHAL